MTPTSLFPNFNRFVSRSSQNVCGIMERFAFDEQIDARMADKELRCEVIKALRICPEKRVDRAIEIAKRSGRKLKIAAKVDPADREYFSDYIKPLLNHPLIELIGELEKTRKTNFSQTPSALLFPIDWP